MPLSAVSGQPRAVDALRGALSKGSIHHAYLFGGPEGVGKELTAVGFAQALLCQEAKGEGCGKCTVCQRIERRNHPDVTWIMPEDELVSRGLAGRSDFDHTPSREVKVEQIRQLQERLSYRALEGRYKVAIIASAEQMNEKAQNAFLKTLEEPSPQTVIILIASGVDQLLPTIRSRCSKVHFGPLPESFVAAKVKAARKLDDETAQLVAVMSGGSLARAMELDVEGLSGRRELIEAFEGAKATDARTILRFAEAYGATREDAEVTLQLLELWTRDLAVAKAGGTHLANRDLSKLANDTVARLSDVDIHRRSRLLGEMAFIMDDRNASPRLQMEKLLIEMKRPEARA
ncbi:MAG: DNA polymerase III subunit delta' [Myxococcaceae bacterium]